MLTNSALKDETPSLPHLDVTLEDICVARAATCPTLVLTPPVPMPSFIQYRGCVKVAHHLITQVIQLPGGQVLPEQISCNYSDGSQYAREWFGEAKPSSLQHALPCRTGSGMQIDLLDHPLFVCCGVKDISDMNYYELE
jgi:hypothetical protein